MNKYDDLFNVKYPFKLKHPRMSIYNRSAIFSPFSALSGYEESINDAGIEVFNKIDLEDNKKDLINNTLIYLKNNDFKDNVLIKYFVKDANKNGGKYLTVSGKIKKIDTINNVIELNNKIRINIDDIFNIERI